MFCNSVNKFFVELSPLEVSAVLQTREHIYGEHFSVCWIRFVLLSNTDEGVHPVVRWRHLQGEFGRSLVGIRSDSLK